MRPAQTRGRLACQRTRRRRNTYPACQHLQGLIYPIRPTGAEVANRDSQGTPLGAMGLGEAARASPGRTAKTFNDETETEQNTKKARRSGPPREGRKGG